MSAFSLIGQLFDGRYVIERQIGSGGMADVYLATDQSLGRKVAIKILSDRYARDAAFVERFRREAAAAASLRHPNIVTVYDRGEAMGTSYIAMEYLDGPTLKEEITQRAPLPEPEAINYATQALAALEAAHRQGVVHRDVKPHNMVLTDEGRLKVTDFGIARAANTQQMTEVGSIVGTAQYLSPEQARGLAVGPESDIYSMGVVLYEMLCGDLPFTGESAVDIAMKQVSDTPPPLNRRNRLVSPAMEQVVMRALAKDPALRFSSAKGMAEELARVSRGQSASADTQQATRVIAAGEATRVIGQAQEGATSVMHQPPPPPPPARPAPRRSAWPWVLVLVLLALAAVAGYVVYSMLSGNDKTVPQSVIGQSCTQATATLKADGLKGHCQTTKSSIADIQKVVRTDPSVGSGVSNGSTVVLLVGVGPSAVTVPHVKGLSADRCDDVAAEQGIQGRADPPQLTSGRTELRLREHTQGGHVAEARCHRDPEGGERVRQIADVSGKSCAAATKELQKLTLKATCQTRSNQAPKGQAFQTYPSAIGTIIPQHSSLTILISNGPAQATLPNVVGEPVGQAKHDLTSAGFRYTVMQVPECTDQSKNNIVQSQSPNGPTAPRGTLVTLTVTKYRPSDPSCGGPPPST